MQTRLAVAMARRVDENVSVTALCEELGISRQTFYVYSRRYDEDGLVGLLPRSRAPLRHPNQVSGDVEDLLVRCHVALAGEGLDAGARSVWARLTREGRVVPSPRTIHRVFVRRGLVTPQPQKAPRRTVRRFQASAPNGCWQIDGMQWRLADSTVVVVIRVIDDHSRKVFRSLVAPSESAEAAWACLQAAIHTHGAPAMLLSDNSLAFNGTRRSIAVPVQQRLRELGIAQVAASAHHPGTCGKVEREHQTLQKWLRAHPAAETIDQLQGLIDAYDDIYNTQRPHQSLPDGLTTPDESYYATTKATAADHPLPTTDEHVADVKVSSRGAITAGKGITIQLGREWEGATVHLVRHGNHAAVFHHGQLVTAITIDPTRRYQPNQRPRGGRRRQRINQTQIVSAMS